MGLVRALQAGMALTIAGRASSIGAGIAQARSVIESGHARAWLRRLQQFAAERATVGPPGQAPGAVRVAGGSAP